MNLRRLLRATMPPTLTFCIGLFAGAWVVSAEIGEPVDRPDQTEPTRPGSPLDLSESDKPPLMLASRSAAAQGHASEQVDGARPQPPGEPEQETDPPWAEQQQELIDRLETLSLGWGRLQAELAALQHRVDSLERRPLSAAADGTALETQQAARPRTPQQQRDALIRAGVDPGSAEEILWRRSQLELGRLELRDQALREGWLGSDRYQEALQALNAERVSLRDELDPLAYDRYLYETGESNRVSVDSVIAGSVGDESGLRPGDVIERYAEQPVFDFNDLRSATSTGSRGELVPVQVRRGGQIVELWLPRGPIGIRLDTARVDPNS